MDPLSIAVSITGIIAAAFHVSQILKPIVDGGNTAYMSAQRILRDVTCIRVRLIQLQDYFSEKQEAARFRRTFISIEQVVIIFTDCVTIFSDLEQTIGSVKTNENTGFLDKAEWSMKEVAIFKIQARLEASKTSINLMLTILTCTSFDYAEASARNLIDLVQEVLGSNINMDARLTSLERIHPALAVSKGLSPTVANAGNSGVDVSMSRRNAHNRRTFEEELESSFVYKRAALSALRLSKSSSSSYGPSCLSGLTLLDIENVSTLILPISSKDLWNYQRYQFKPPDINKTHTLLDGWYNPPAKSSAFIRTAYFNGQYTNQYAQSKSTGHLIYRRFTVAARYSPPVFTEGATMPSNPEELGPVIEKVSRTNSPPVFELEGTTPGPDRSVRDADDDILRLESALDMLASEDTPRASIIFPDYVLKTELKMQSARNSTKINDVQPQLQPTEPVGITTCPDPALLAPPSNRVLPLSPNPHPQSSSHTRCTSPSLACSLLCEEEEAVFPTRKWVKPLSNMGNALNWRLDVLSRFDRIV